MRLLTVNAMLGLGAPPASGQQQPPIWVSMGPLVLLMVVFYFILIRPQQKKAKEHATLLKSIRAGDKIVTSGGVVASVVTVKDKTLTIRSADAKLEITKTAVAEILERGAESGES